MALLFGSLPLAGQLVLGSWGFGDAALFAVLCFLAGGYLRLRARRFRVAPDAAMLLDRAFQFAAAGEKERAIAVLSEAIRLSPWLWQAFQYRGELQLQDGRPADAIQDFDAAIRLAPGEEHIRALRSYAEAQRTSGAENPS